jgi:LuxR family maltose regulon positive regulatory protein
VSQSSLRLIDRDRLLAELDRAVDRKVTVVSAPAGSGKTSLLHAWAERAKPPRRLAVVQVRRDQRDAQIFWLAVLDAVRRASGTADAAQPSAVTPDFNGAAIVERVLSELADAHGGVILVIDDLHELNSPDARAQLTRLLTDLPARTHAVLATRHDLPLRLHQLRLAGEIAEIRAAELRFTEHETRELLEASGIELSQAGAMLLHQRTEGWAAGLRLAALSLANHPDPERFVAEFSGSDRAVAEYLIAEMLERQPPEVQRLLLRTSLLDRVNGELADLLTGRPGSERILLELEDANAFVVSLDRERTWFRYHHLLADFLRLEVRRALPEEAPALHRQAAQWLAERGEVIDAVRHTQAAGDWSEAARLLADHAFSLMLDGHVQTVQEQLRAFPKVACADHPELAVAHATCDFVHGRLVEAAARLATAESHADTLPPERRRRLRVAIGSLKLSVARRRGLFADVMEQVHILTSPLSGQSGEHPVLDGDQRAVALLNLGIVEAWSRKLKDGERHLREGALLARELGRPYLEVSCLAHLGFASKGSSLAASRQRCREAVALAERHGWGAESVIATALVTLAGTMIWTGEFDEGERLLERAVQAVQADTAPGMRMQLHLVTGMMLAGRGDLHRALEQFVAAERRQSQLAGSHVLAGQVTGWTIATQARLGMLGEARAALAALTDDRATLGELRNADATIRLADGEPAKALGALREVLDGTASVIYDFTVVEAWLLAALAHGALGDRHAANRSTERALAAAEPDRLVLPFTMPGGRELLEALPRRETAHAALLADTLDLLHGSALRSTDRSAPPRTRDLSPSELKVLRYLPTNLSRPQIAGELSVSLNTVNTHVRSIYAKLGANDRSSAVRRARQLRLLSTGLAH